jgi:glycosyltransferase involved in cell wall biosynthesis
MATDGGNGPVRVGIVTTSFPVEGNPASGIFVQRLASSLPESVDATVLIPRPATRPPDRSGQGFRVTTFSYAPRKWSRLAHEPGGIPDALRRRDPVVLIIPFLVMAMFLACLRLAGRVDVIHANWSLPGLLGGISAKLRGRAAITTLRGSDVTRAQGSRIDRWILGACLATNDRTITVSQAMLDSVRAAFPTYADRVEFISDGVESLPPRGGRGLSSPLRLVTVSNLVRSKRVDTLLTMLGDPACPADAVLRVVGDGPERTALERMALARGVRERVEFVGRVPPDEVSRHLQWADIFVFASESEGRPSVVLEAMAAGLPVIASDIPGTRELLHPTAGILLPVGDATGLAEAVRKLRREPGLVRDLQIAGPTRIAELGLSWHATGHRYAELYRRLAAG